MAPVFSQNSNGLIAGGTAEPLHFASALAVGGQISFRPA
jgi:hypothetical protein